MICENCVHAYEGMPNLHNNACLFSSKCSTDDSYIISKCNSFEPKPLLTLGDANGLFNDTRTHIVDRDENGPVNRVYADDKIVCEEVGHNEKPPEKPPLGVTPVYIVAYRRMEELCDAIKNELHYDNTDLNTIIRWAKEIQLQSNLVIEMGKKADKNE